MRKLLLTLVALFFSGLTLHAQNKDGLYAEMETSKGEILLRLHFQATPLTVANFIGLAEGDIAYDTVTIEEPYYDGITFHRVIDDFMIQGGDPTGSGSGNPGYLFYDEFVDSLKHTGPGILSMANSGPNTNGSQFFITHKKTPWLNGKHTVFGKVVEGQAVVDSIEQGDKIISIDIKTKGRAARKFDAQEVFTKQMKLRKKQEAEKQKKQKADQAKKYKQQKKAFQRRMKGKYTDVQMTSSGLMYMIEQEGTGPKVQKGDQVKLHYYGRIVGGQKFDASYDRNKPITFKAGVGRMIKGWDEGMLLLKEGAKAKLIVPYYLGYGKKARKGIPARSDLIFDIELLEVNPQ